MQRPDVLVLGAGGTIGAAWMGGVLAGIADTAGIDFAACEHLVGTSAGAMLAADVLARVEPLAPEHGGEAAGPAAAPEPQAAGPLRGTLARIGGAAAPAVPLALSAMRPLSSRIRAAALARIDERDASLEDLRARIAGHGLAFDGRLRVACVDRATGRRITFGAPGAPPADVAAAVQASCSVPWTHRPVQIGERSYVDGAVWSPTNLDAAPALRDTHVLCLAPAAGSLGGVPRHPAVRAATSAALALETAVLNRRGARLQLVTPETARPGEHVRATGYRQGVSLAREGLSAAASPG